MIGARRNRGLLVGLGGSFAGHVLVAALAGTIQLPMPARSHAPDLPASSSDERSPGFPGQASSGTPVNQVAPTPSADAAAESAEPAAPADDSAAASPLPSLMNAGPVTALAGLMGERSWTARDLVTHLWQSTLFVIAMYGLAVFFRRNRADVRYWLWFAGSMKFLVPFSLLVSAGSYMAGFLPATSLTNTTSFLLSPLDINSLPNLSSATASQIDTATASGQMIQWGITAALALWATGFVLISAVRLRQWLRLRAALRGSVPFDTGDRAIPPQLRVRSLQGPWEPGVIGWRRPTLLLPAGIETRLSSAELDAVLLHEVCHVRRHDNLTAGIHMVVEALFWFHPMVWWIGGKLVTERERACDEAVVGAGHEPVVYANSILRTCELYRESALACVAGVTGSDLRARIESIVTGHASARLGAWKSALLGVATVATLVGPIAIGGLNGSRVHAQVPSTGAATGLAFEVLSVRPNTSGELRSDLSPQPGGRFTGMNVTPAMLIRFAYDLPVFQVTGGPDWIASERFDILAKAAGDASLEQTREMVRRLLAERFALRARVETRELPMYALVLARNDGRLGPQLRRSTADCRQASGPANDAIGMSPDGGPPVCGYFGMAPGTHFPSGRGGFGFRGLTMADLAKRLLPMVRRSVSEMTGLTGYFDGEFAFIAEVPPPPPPPGMPNPFTQPFESIFTVLPEQLGLKLDSRRGPVPVLVIDSVERPRPQGFD